MKKYYLFLFLLTTLFIFSCKSDNPAESDTPTDSGNKIGADGGIITYDDAQLKITSGTFTSEQSLTITKINAPAEFAADAISSTFLVENVPIEFSNPIEVSVKVNGTFTGDTLLAVKAPSYSVSGNMLEDQIIFIKGKITDGVLTAEIDNITQDSFAKSTGKNEDGKFVFSFFALGNHVSYVTGSNHFRIFFPSGSDRSAITNVGQILENCYTTVYDLGFKLYKRTKWPMDVEVVKNLGNAGEYITSKRSMNYDFMKVDAAFLNDDIELKATLIHEFFHAAQTMYNPHWNFTSTVLGAWSNGYEHLWLDEAVSTWIEAYFLNDDTYTDQNFTANFPKILDGLASVKSDVQGYGYGMAIFIEYITKKYGKEVLVKIYEKILNRSNSLDAISSICSLNIDFDWNDFMQDLVQGKVDPNKFNNRVFMKLDGIKKKITEFKTIEETIPLKMSSISAKMYDIQFPFQIESDKNAQITFSTTYGDLYIFKVGSNYSDLKRIASTNSEITITGLKEIIDNKEILIVILANGRIPFPYDGTKDITFKYKFEEAIDFTKVQSATISVRAAADENIGGVITPSESYLLPKFSPNNDWRGVWVGNKFIIDFSSCKFSDTYTNVSGTFNLIYDPVKKEISELNFDVSYTINGYRNIYTKLVLQNLAFSNYNTQFGANYAFLEFIKLGEGVSENIKVFEYSETNTENGVVTNVNYTGTNSKSQVWIKLNEF